jgi:hypothetical protein
VLKSKKISKVVLKIENPTGGRNSNNPIRCLGAMAKGGQKALSEFLLTHFFVAKFAMSRLYLEVAKIDYSNSNFD